MNEDGSATRYRHFPDEPEATQMQPMPDGEWIAFEDHEEVRSQLINAKGLIIIGPNDDASEVARLINQLESCKELCALKDAKGEANRIENNNLRQKLIKLTSALKEASEALRLSNTSMEVAARLIENLRRELDAARPPK